MELQRREVESLAEGSPRHHQVVSANGHPLILRPGLIYLFTCRFTCMHAIDRSSVPHLKGLAPMAPLVHQHPGMAGASLNSISCPHCLIRIALVFGVSQTQRTASPGSCMWQKPRREQDVVAAHPLDPSTCSRGLDSSPVAFR